MKSSGEKEKKPQAAVSTPAPAAVPAAAVAAEAAPVDPGASDLASRMAKLAQVPMYLLLQLCACFAYV